MTIDWNTLFRYEDGEIYWKVVKGCRTTKPLGNLVSRYCVISLHSPKRMNLQRGRVVWEMHNGPVPEGMVIDRIDGNALNDRIENLRCVSISMDRRNLAKQRTSTGVLAGTGISWQPEKSRFQVSVQVQGKQRKLYFPLGQFQEAAAARIEHLVRYEFTQRHGKEQLQKIVEGAFQ